MLIVLGILLALVPFAIVFWTRFKTSSPALQWPSVAAPLNLQFADKPPRIVGDWEGRHMGAEPHNNSVLVTLQLSQPSRLRVEVGAKEEVVKRAGMLVPDPVATGDSAFEARLLARCSDRQAGQVIFEPTMRQLLMGQTVVDVLGAGDKIQWRLPELVDTDTLERVLQVMTAVASEMERYPANA
jgi:hypothetical protein